MALPAELILKLKIKRNEWLFADTFYNLGARLDWPTCVFGRLCDGNKLFSICRNTDLLKKKSHRISTTFTYSVLRDSTSPLLLDKKRDQLMWRFCTQGIQKVDPVCAPLNAYYFHEQKNMFDKSLIAIHQAHIFLQI